VIVLDASAAVDWLLQTNTGQQIEARIYSHRESLHAPHVIDLEVLQVFRRLVRDGTMAEQRGHEAVQDLLDLRMTRYTHSLFLTRIWQHRHNFSAYDAAYVALAERLGATLLTRDARLASAAASSVEVELIQEYRGS
jgi:predicted nucleic acid-binding protein